MNKDLANPKHKDGKCPHCDIYREWDWNGYIRIFVGNYAKHIGYYAYCSNCAEYVIYYKEKMIYPKNNLPIKPNVLFDRYEKSKKLFLEAVEVSTISARAGLTLSRMCLESLTNEILQENKQKIDENFNEKIEKLYELNIINAKLKNLLSSARIIGNKSTHNFNIIDTENEPNTEDAIIVLETIDHILENMRISSEKEEKLFELEQKVKAKNAEKTNQN